MICVDSLFTMQHTAQSVSRRGLSQMSESFRSAHRHGLLAISHMTVV